MSAQEEWPYQQALEQVCEVFGWPGCLSPAETVEAARAEKALADAGRVADVVQPQVFRAGDPEPGPEVVAVLDCDGDVWTRDVHGCWDCAVDSGSWSQALKHAPLVSCGPLPDYGAAVRVDAERRAAEQATGGADDQQRCAGAEVAGDAP